MSALWALFICVWLSGLTPTFNSCGKCSQTFHCQVSLFSYSYSASVCLFFCLCVCLLAFLSFCLELSLSLSPLHTHTHTPMQAHDPHTSGLIFIASSSFTWHGSLNRCAPALSSFPLSPPLLSVSLLPCASLILPYLISGRKRTKLAFNLKIKQWSQN